MEQQLTGAIQQLIQDKAAEDKYTTLNSKSMCIGCGRSSLVRSIPSTRVQSPNFVSTLTGPPLPGSDILRAGFKMSVRGIQSPLSPNSLAGLDLMTDDNLANDGSSFGDSVAPIVPMFGEPAGPYATNRLQPGSVRAFILIDWCIVAMLCMESFLCVLTTVPACYLDSIWHFASRFDCAGHSTRTRAGRGGHAQTDSQERIPWEKINES